MLYKCFEMVGVIGQGASGRVRKQIPFDKLISKAVENFSSVFLSERLEDHATHLQVLSATAIFNTATAFPALTRAWWIALARPQSMRVGSYFEKYISPLVILDEFSRLSSINLVNDDTNSGDDEINADMRVHLDRVARAVVATYIKDDCYLEIGIELPQIFPLKQVKVNCRKSLGVREDRWRRWSLQIVTMLSKRDGSLMDGIKF